jgi:hypothetical protein
MYYPNWKRKTTDMREHEMHSLAFFWKQMYSLALKKHHLGKTGHMQPLHSAARFCLANSKVRLQILFWILEIVTKCELKYLSR